MSHWFAGWKFWPDRAKGPVGEAYRQVTWIRPYRPGPLRVLRGARRPAHDLPALIAFSILLSPGPFVPRLVYGAAFGLIAAGLAIAVLPVLRRRRLRQRCRRPHPHDAGRCRLPLAARDRRVHRVPRRSRRRVTASSSPSRDSGPSPPRCSAAALTSSAAPSSSRWRRWPSSAGGATPGRWAARGTSARTAQVVPLDRRAHRRPGTASVTGVVVGDGQPEPGAPVVRVGLDLPLSLGEPRVGRLRAPRVPLACGAGRPPAAHRTRPARGRARWCGRRTAARGRPPTPRSPAATTSAAPSTTATGSPLVTSTHERCAMKTR